MNIYKFVIASAAMLLSPTAILSQEVPWTEPTASYSDISGFPDLSVADVINIKIGMPAAEALMIATEGKPMINDMDRESLTSQTKIGTVLRHGYEVVSYTTTISVRSNDGFTLAYPEITTEHLVREAQDILRYGLTTERKASGETLSILLGSPITGERVQQITREFSFDGPVDGATLVASIIDKYGEPTAQKEVVVNIGKPTRLELYWTYNDGQQNMSERVNKNLCFNSLAGGHPSRSPNLYYQVGKKREMPAKANLKCDAGIIITLYPSYDAPDSYSGMNIVINDLKAQVVDLMAIDEDIGLHYKNYLEGAKGSTSLPQL